MNVKLEPNLKCNLVLLLLKDNSGADVVPITGAEALPHSTEFFVAF